MDSHNILWCLPSLALVQQPQHKNLCKSVKSILDLMLSSTFKTATRVCSNCYDPFTACDQFKVAQHDAFNICSYSFPRLTSTGNTTPRKNLDLTKNHHCTCKPKLFPSKQLHLGSLCVLASLSSITSNYNTYVVVYYLCHHKHFSPHFSHSVEQM